MKLFHVAKKTNFEIKVSTLVASFTFFTLGLYSWGPKWDLSTSLMSLRNLYAISFLLVEILSVALLSAYLNTSRSKITIRSDEFWVSLFSAAIFFAINPEFFSLRLAGDELFHAQSAVVHSAEIVNIFEGALEKYQFSTFLNMDYRNLLSIAQILVIILFLLIIKIFIAAKNLFIRIAIFLAVLITSISFIGFGYKYPSGYVVPQFIISTFSISTLSFRFVQILILMMLVSISTRKLFTSYPTLKKILLNVAIFEIPIITYGATQIEQSVYFAIVGGLILFKLSIREAETDNEKLFALIALLIFCRSPAIVFLLPVAFRIYQNQGIQFKKWITSPLVAIVPVIFVSISEAIFARLGGNANSSISAYTLETNKTIALWNSIRTEFDTVSIIFLVISITYLLATKKTRFISFAYLFICSTIYSLQIPNAVVGLNKYALELFAPVIIFSALHFIWSRKANKNRRSEIVFLTMAGGLVLLNALNGPPKQLENSLDNWKQHKTLINYPVTVDIEKVVLSKYNKKDCVNLGSTYGHFNYVLSGLNLVQFKDLNRNQLPDIDSLEWGKGLKAQLDLHQYRCLVLDAYPLKSQMRQYLINQGFRVEFERVGPFYGTKSQIWEKDLNPK